MVLVELYKLNTAILEITDIAIEFTVFA